MCCPVISRLYAYTPAPLIAGHCLEIVKSPNASHCVAFKTCTRLLITGCFARKWTSVCPSIRAPAHAAEVYAARNGIVEPATSVSKEGKRRGVSRADAESHRRGIQKHTQRPCASEDPGTAPRRHKQHKAMRISEVRLKRSPGQSSESEWKSKDQSVLRRRLWIGVLLVHAKRGSASASRAADACGRALLRSRAEGRALAESRQRLADKRLAHRISR